MTPTELLLHWIYVCIMFGSAIAFYILSRNDKGVPQYKYLIHLFIVVWSGLAYSSLALDRGYTIVNEQKVHYARYIDWVVSTPLLLLSLTLTGKYTIKSRRHYYSSFTGLAGNNDYNRTSS